MATIICPRFRPQMATVRPGVLKKGEYNEAKANAVVVEPVAFELSDADIKTKVLEVVKEAKELVDLTGAEVVVSVGRGISKDVDTGIKLAEELAGLFGGVVGGCSGHFRRDPAQGWHAGFRVHRSSQQV